MMHLLWLNPMGEHGAGFLPARVMAKRRMVVPPGCLKSVAKTISALGYETKAPNR
jgi:hypothetical protein